MRVHLAFNYAGLNHSYQKKLWEEAVRSMGWESSIVYNADLTVMWGPNPPFNQTRARKKPVLMIDFPYWNRRKDKNGEEFYKVSLNGQHPTPYIMTENHNSDRFFATGGTEPLPWKTGGDYILLAGMGPKAAHQFGYEQGQWERKIANIIKKQTDLPILYRPKPNRGGSSLVGTIYDNGQKSIAEVVSRAACVVCHHGNPTIDALWAGVPIFMNAHIGAASHLASFDFENINKPFKPDNRQQFFNNIAHWQFSVDEIKSGAVFKSFRDRGFI